MARIIQLSDVHFGGEHPVAVAKAADFIRETPFDLLLTTGDITAFGRIEEFSTAALWYSSLPGPQMFTPGNHDTPWLGLIQRVISPFGRYADRFGDPDAAQFVGAGLRVQALNTSRGWQVRADWSKGEIVNRQVDRALAGLDGPPAGIRIVACHHPLTEITGGPMTARVRGGTAAARRFAEGGVDLILTGHIHVPFAHPLSFGDRKTWSIGCGTLSVRERGFVPSFNVIDTDGGSVRVTAMGFAGSAFEARKTWSLDLRPRV